MESDFKWINSDLVSGIRSQKYRSVVKYIV